jgi:hypothetical protein
MNGSSHEIGINKVTDKPNICIAAVEIENMSWATHKKDVTLSIKLLNKGLRHYGIMAQDFYNAFGHDNYGTIGNDTTVNPIDMIGIDMTAIQALEKRTADLKAENENLKMQNDKLQARLQKLEDKLLAK